MGVKESTGEKGLFPANFTRPIWKHMWNIKKDISQQLFLDSFTKEKKYRKNIHLCQKSIV